MCESTVVLRKGVNETTIMDDVVKLNFDGVKVTCINILGERKSLENVTIREANLVDHRIILEERQ